MLATNELQKYIMSEINDKLDEISYSNVFFEKGDDNSAEGTYIFSTNSNYHILYAEKGKIRSDIVVNDEREVLWYALNILSTNITMKYAMNNQEKGKDFRRPLFEKEKKIFALFGEDFLKRKDEEINEILEKNPYNDI